MTPTILSMGVLIVCFGGIAVLFAWGLDRMTSPSFTVDEATVAGFNLTADNHLTANFSVSIRSHNRDSKYSIEYKSVTVMVCLNDFGLAYQLNIIGVPINQAHGDEVAFKAHPTARNLKIFVGDVAGELRNQTMVGPLKVEVSVRASVRFEVKHWSHSDFIIKVNCFPVIIDWDLGTSFDGTMCDKVDRFDI